MSQFPPAGSVPPIEPPPRIDSYAPVVPPPAPPYAAPSYTPGTYAHGYYAAPQQPKGLGIASMVTGIVGVFFSLGYGLGLFPAIAAIITGHLAQKRQPHARGFWIAGLVTGYVGLFLSLIGVGLLILIIVLAVSSGGSSGSYSDLGNP